MVYNMFLLNLRLDPGVFDPFTEVGQLPVQIDKSIQEDGDCYELADEGDTEKIISSCQPDYLIKIDTEQVRHINTEGSYDSIDVMSRTSKSCLECLMCKQSPDPFAGSSSYVCQETGEVIEDECQAVQCTFFNPEPNACDGDLGEDA